MTTARSMLSSQEEVGIPSERSESRNLAVAGAFSLVEVMVSILVVLLMLVGTLEAVSASLRTQAVLGERARGLFLAQDLMTEILQQKYKDAFQLPILFGPELGDVDLLHPAVRTGLNDVDDYSNWTDSPPHARDGTAVVGFDAGWARTSNVVWINPDTGNVTILESGVKRITVKVTHNNKTVATLTAVATDSWQYAPYE